MRLRFETIFLVWFQAQSCTLYDVEGCSNRFFSRCPLVFSVWYTSPQSSLQHLVWSENHFVKNRQKSWHSLYYDIVNISSSSLPKHLFRFVIFEFSPWLIVLGGKSCLGSYCYLGALSFQSKRAAPLSNRYFLHWSSLILNLTVAHLLRHIISPPEQKPKTSSAKDITNPSAHQLLPWKSMALVGCNDLLESLLGTKPTCWAGMRLRFQLTLLAKAAVILGSRRTQARQHCNGKWCTGGVIPGSVPRNWNVKSSSPKCSASTKSTRCFMFYDTVLTRCPGISTMTPGALWYKLLISDRHAMSFFCWFFENTPCNILLATIPA